MEIKHYDSLKIHNTNALVKKIIAFLKARYEGMTNTIGVISKYTKENLSVPTVSIQQNGYDCGVYCIEFGTLFDKSLL